MVLANTRVFVGGFDIGTSKAQIQAHCAAAGKIVALEMRGRGAAVVTYGTAGGAQKAIALLNQSTIFGNSRFIDVKEDAMSRPGPPLAANGAAVARKRPEQPAEQPALVLRNVATPQRDCICFASCQIAQTSKS